MSKTKHIDEQTWWENPYEIRTLVGDHYISSPLDENRGLPAHIYLEMCAALPIYEREILTISRKYMGRD